MQIDANIAAYFTEILRNKYGHDLSEAELNSKLSEISNRFTDFLLNEFKLQVAMTTQQEVEFRSLYNNSLEALHFLEQIVKMNTDYNLDNILVEILNSFVTQYSNQF